MTKGKDKEIIALQRRDRPKHCFSLIFKGDTIGVWSEKTKEVRLSSVRSNFLREAVFSFGRDDLVGFFQDVFTQPGAVMSYQHAAGTLHFCNYDVIRQHFNEDHYRGLYDVDEDIRGRYRLLDSSRKHSFKLVDKGDGMRHVEFRSVPIGWITGLEAGIKLTVPTLYGNLMYENSEPFSSEAELKDAIERLRDCGLHSYDRFGRRLYFINNESIMCDITEKILSSEREISLEHGSLEQVKV